LQAFGNLGSFEKKNYTQEHINFSSLKITFWTPGDLGTPSWEPLF